MIIIVSHAAFSKDMTPMYGTGSQIAPILKNEGMQYIYIQHPLEVGARTLIEKYTSEESSKNYYGLRSLPFVLRIFQEQFINFYFCFKYGRQNGIYIGIDPLNGFSGVMMKRLLIIKKTIFYTADYANKRFNNVLLNKLYHWLDRFVVSFSDEIWNVSWRILLKRKEQGVTTDKNIFMPNTPDISKIPKTESSKVNRFQLVLVSTISSTINFDLILQTIKELSKKHKQIKLIIVGSGPYEEQLKKEITLKQVSANVDFIGKKQHGELSEIIGSSRVGIALYTQNNPWTWYGDSMKVREYVAHGVPVVMNDACSTAEDIRNEQAGIIVKHTNVSELERAIQDIIENQGLYEKMRKKAFILAEKFDIHRMVLNQLNTT